MEIGQPFFMELGRSGVGEVGREKIFSPSPPSPDPPKYRYLHKYLHWFLALADGQEEEGAS